jgi:hypothetical protein
MLQELMKTDEDTLKKLYNERWSERTGEEWTQRQYVPLRSRAFEGNSKQARIFENTNAPNNETVLNFEICILDLFQFRYSN